MPWVNRPPLWRRAAGLHGLAVNAKTPGNLKKRRTTVMPDVLETILQRRSIRSYRPSPIPIEVVDQIIQAAMRAPTAGNMMLYSIIEIADQALKDRLAETCDHQPFIAKAPLVLLFVADYQRWNDLFDHFDVDDYCQRVDQARRYPQEGDLMLACCDALIAAQTAVLAAEALGIGSCYIGDIMEQYETHRELLELPPYVFPVCMLCFGYPNASALERPLTPRFGRAQIVFKNRYRSLGEEELEHLLDGPGRRSPREPARNVGQAYYRHKFASAFSREMSRSVRAALATWCHRQRQPPTQEKEPHG
jgi:nitroreductase